MFSFRSGIVKLDLEWEAVLEAEQSRRWTGPGAHRQAFAERALAHKLNTVRDAAGAAGFTKFEISLAMLRYGVREMMVAGRDPDVIDAALAEATALAMVIKEEVG